MVMDSSRNYPLGSKASAFTVAFIMFLTFLSLKSVSGVDDHGESFSEMKRKVGSKPPTCINKCFKCKPCTPTLVPSHGHQKGLRSKTASSHVEDDENYYPLFWKCLCKYKYFEP